MAAEKLDTAGTVAEAVEAADVRGSQRLGQCQIVAPSTKPCESQRAMVAAKIAKLRQGARTDLAPI